MMTATSSLRRVIAVGWTELIQLWRAPVKMLAMLILPVVLPWTTLRAYSGDSGELQAKATIAMAIVVITSVHFFLIPVTAMAFRRESGFLQRLQCSELRRREILTSVFMPGIVMGSSILLGWLIVFKAIGLPLPSHPLSFLLGILLTTFLASVLSLITAGFTKSVESVQLTCIPGVFIIALGPPDTIRRVLPDHFLAEIVSATPFASAFDMLNAAYNGEDSLQYLILTAVWTIILSVGAHFVFRWNPRD